MSPLVIPLRAIAIALVFAGIGYTALLCLTHTIAFPVTNEMVALVDAAVVLAALALALWGASPPLWMLALAIAFNFLFIALVGDAFHVKAVRDVLVLVAFAALGRRFGDLRAGRTLYICATVIVVGFALVELLAPTLYTRLFDVFDFYADRGALTQAQIQHQSSNFFVSGERGDGRLIAPWLSVLGAHRASSVFLEPVSLGNFGALAAAFALALPRAQRRTAWIIGTGALFAIFVADARFAAASVVLFIFARFVPPGLTTIVLACLPLVAIGLLFGISALAVETGDTFIGRLAISGAALTSFEPDMLFGLRPYGVSTVDAGYAYALSNFGLPLCVALWAAFVAFPARTEMALRYKLLLGVYACALLCVSGSSLFALKTAAIGWFALGALAAQPVAVRAAAAMRSRAQVGVPA